MKKIVLAFFCLTMINSLFAEESEEKYILKNIKKEYIGYYVSLDFIAAFEKTKEYVYAFNLRENNTYYAHIIVNKNNMHYYPFGSDCYFEVSQQWFEEFHFDYISDDEITVTDHKGNKYKKMTRDTENYWSIMNNYIGNIATDCQ